MSKRVHMVELGTDSALTYTQSELLETIITINHFFNLLIDRGFKGSWSPSQSHSKSRSRLASWSDCGRSSSRTQMCPWPSPYDLCLYSAGLEGPWPTWSRDVLFTSPPLSSLLNVICSDILCSECGPPSGLVKIHEQEKGVNALDNVLHRP